MSNHLKNTTSPYLLQHSENPVNWFSWCEEAFVKAKLEDKPIFLSIGYSTCHWCHVMAHESFEDIQTADLLNKNFISIKVDREERPDIDSVYMAVCQAITGNGGWPMSIFMTADKKPFFAGTYFPLSSKYGIPSFKDLLLFLLDHWHNKRSQLFESAEKIIEHIKADNIINNNIEPKKLVEKAVQIFSQSFDYLNGGFGAAPKFPTPHNLLFLMLYSQLNNDLSIYKMVEKTLMQMRKGGIFDHIGYGFSRYSTDEIFLAPHFEKMLYDNALMMIAYAVIYNISEEKIYLDTCERIADYILREMTSPDGGFYCAQDADIEGVEGKYYTFTLNEIINILGNEKGKEFAKAFDITENGNFEGMNIPNLLRSNNLSDNFDLQLQKLYDYRKKRAILHLDDKILTSWNALMIIAMSILYRVSKNEKYLKAASDAQKFIEKNLYKDSKIYTSFRDKDHTENGFLDDYAFYIMALIEMYNSTLNKEYLEKAQKLCYETIEYFADDENGGFYLCKKNNNELFMNPKETYDGAIPSGNSVMAYNFVRLSQLIENESFNVLAKSHIDFMSSKTQNYPTGNSMFLLSILLDENPPPHIVIVQKEKVNPKKIISKLPFISNVIIMKENNEYTLLNDKTTYYICKNFSCLPPTNYLDEIED